ncbi:hypothetical protein [Rubellimicrobium sp. CFH 75288]|uniref:hypothetical protein n=1 Tax=Rubellimicrobium sp. CFH 75288 TaxID=2697034 RepID=UPI001411DDB5|nr:hypothetical protein [Rubellimicrobium sp. CFH 75288]NAZ37145.1 hypothetical protein [Rubellimicrobium sp. CFH 75288]
MTMDGVIAPLGFVIDTRVLAEARAEAQALAAALLTVADAADRQELALGRATIRLREAVATAHQQAEATRGQGHASTDAAARVAVLEAALARAVEREKQHLDLIRQAQGFQPTTLLAPSLSPQPPHPGAAPPCPRRRLSRPRRPLSGGQPCLSWGRSRPWVPCRRAPRSTLSTGSGRRSAG